MRWLAILLSLVALAATLVDRRTALICAAAALLIGVWLMVRHQHRRTATTAVVLAVVAALLSVAVVWDLRRPASTASPDRAAYTRPADGSRPVTLPLTVQTDAMKALALLEFAEGADPILRGFEPQIIERNGRHGLRVLAYRTDGRADMYDDVTLPFDPDETQQVTGEGAGRHRQVAMENTDLSRDAQGRVHISFAFTDADGRRIRVDIGETTTRTSVPTNILAPIGTSSTNPESFPLFLLRDFDFVRISGTRFDVRIDDRPIALAPFPVPLPVQGQLRSFAKYSLQPDIIELFPTKDRELRRARTQPGTDVVVDGETRYLFAGEALERILVRDTEVIFTPALDLSRPTRGRFEIASHPDLGVLTGDYEIAVDGTHSELKLAVTEVKVPTQHDPLYKLIVNERTLFGTWPKDYAYQARIDRTTGAVDAHWRNRKHN